LSSNAIANNAAHLARGADLMGSSLSRSKPARLCTSFRKDSIPRLMANCGIILAETKSPASDRKSAKDESSTQAARHLSFDARRIAVAAPMERPHSAIDVTRPECRKCRITTLRSRSSLSPKETCSPPDSPEPAKSKLNTSISSGKRKGNTSNASSLEELQPCRNTTQGRAVFPACSGR